MKNENLKLILIAFGITACVCVLINLGNNVIPERLKFDVNIWGTVNSWLVYGLTVVTAVFLYKTLRSQQEVQKMQLDIKEIETHKFRNNLRPNLLVKSEEFDNKSSIISFSLDIQNNSLKQPRFVSPYHLKFSSHISVEKHLLDNGFLYIINDYISPADNRTINIEIDFDPLTWRDYEYLGEQYKGFFGAFFIMNYSDTKNFMYENLIGIVLNPIQNTVKVSLGDANFV
ncbi:MAG: hypothetical protein LBE37_21660 [Sphingobacterium sp.]|jgi:hypothetical protein|nr:hypothetical protein [Sphingobacterium sp.]